MLLSLLGRIMDKAPSRWTQLNGMFLVGGTCIGGGMLALPVAAGVGGYLPSITWLVVSWLIMTASSLLLLEANLWMREGEHVISMAKRLLGPLGKAVSWLLYLYIGYASLVSYSAGGGRIFTQYVNEFFSLSLSQAEGIILVTAALVAVIYLGAKTVGRINTVLFMGMILSYILLVGLGIDEVNPLLHSTTSWVTSLLALPLLLTSFSHQTMVPSLTPYLMRNGKALRWAIVGGTTIAFVVYFLWLTLVLGIVPVEGENGLIEAYLLGVPATEFVNFHVQGFWLSYIVNFFSFFAIVTSFLGIGFGLFDFLSDGLSIEERGLGKVGLGLLIIIPTLYFAIYYERAFIVAMETTGGVGDALLNGIIPIMMVWSGRYLLGYKSEWRLFGGKPLLIILGLLFLFVLLFEVLMLSTNIVHDWLSIR